MIQALLLVPAMLLAAVQADSRTDRLIDGLLSVGARALQDSCRHESEIADEPAGDVHVSPDSSAPADRNWRDRGKAALGTLLTGTVDGLGERPLGEVLSAALKEAVDGLVDEYKEQYKQEGREYVREVGNMLVVRVMEDPRISGSIYSLQVLCWGTVVYLTIVTLFMVYSLLRITRMNRQLMEAVALLQHSGTAPSPTEENKTPSEPDSEPKNPA